MTVKELNTLAEDLLPSTLVVVRQEIHKLRNEINTRLLEQDEKAQLEFAEINRKLDALGDGKTVRALIKYGAWVAVALFGYLLKGKIEWPSKS